MPFWRWAGATIQGQIHISLCQLRVYQFTSLCSKWLALNWGKETPHSLLKYPVFNENLDFGLLNHLLYSYFKILLLCVSSCVCVSSPLLNFGLHWLVLSHVWNFHCCYQVNLRFSLSYQSFNLKRKWTWSRPLGCNILVIGFVCLLSSFYPLLAPSISPWFLYFTSFVEDRGAK